MVRLGDVLKSQPKSTIKAGCGEKTGKYKFFTSSSEQTKYIDVCTYNQEAIILGTGGNANIHYCNEPFSTSTDCFVYIAQNSVSVEAIYRYLSGNIHILQDGFKGAGLKHISKKYIEDIMLPLPSNSKQQEIAAVLDKASELVEKRKAQLAELDALAESIFYDMFGDPVTNENNFARILLGKISKVTSSKRVYQSELTNDGVPFYKISDLMNIINQLVVENSSFITEELYNRLFNQGSCPKFGDILVTSRGTLGECYIVKPDDKFYFQDGMISWLLPNTSLVNSIYLKYAFKTVDIKQQIEDNSNGATVNYLSISKLRELNFILPPLPLQQQFAERIEKIELQKQKVKAALKESEDLFQRLMQDMFNPEYHNS